MPKLDGLRNVGECFYDLDFRFEFSRKQSKNIAKVLIARNESINVAFHPFQFPAAPKKNTMQLTSKSPAVQANKKRSVRLNRCVFVILIY